MENAARPTRGVFLWHPSFGRYRIMMGRHRCMFRMGLR